MAIIEKFWGHHVEIPEDRHYDIKQGLWGRRIDNIMVFGLTQPALVLFGWVKGIDWLVEESQMVQKRRSILRVITGKNLCLEAPVAGNVHFNKIIRRNSSYVSTDPYDQGWLFLIEPEGDLDLRYQALASADTYLESLHHSEGFGNSKRPKRVIAGACKAVTSGRGL